MIGIQEKKTSLVEQLERFSVDYVPLSRSKPEIKDRYTKSNPEYKGKQENKDNEEKEDKPYNFLDDLNEFLQYLLANSNAGSELNVSIGIQYRSRDLSDRLQQGIGYDTPELRDEFRRQGYSGKDKGKSSGADKINNRNSTIGTNSRAYSTLDSLLEGSHEETLDGSRRTEYQSLQKGLRNDTAKYFGTKAKEVGEGGIIFVDEENKVVEQYGTANDIAGAKILMERYQRFVNQTELGRELGNRISKELGNDGKVDGAAENRIDGYAFMEMGEGVRAAVLKYSVNGQERRVLGINKKYAQSLFQDKDKEITLDEADVLGHERGHLQDLDHGKTGIHAEEHNDGRLSGIYDSIAKDPRVSSLTRSHAEQLSYSAENRLESLPRIYGGSHSLN